MKYNELNIQSRFEIPFLSDLDLKMDRFQAKEGTTPLPMHDADSSKQKTAFLVKQKEKSLERISFVLVDNDYESKSSAATVARNRVTKSWNSTIEPTHR